VADLGGRFIPSNTWEARFPFSYVVDGQRRRVFLARCGYENGHVEYYTPLIVRILKAPLYVPAAIFDLVTLPVQCHIIEKRLGDMKF
jgi:hypothetical protein